MSNKKSSMINPELTDFDFRVISQFGHIIAYNHEGYEHGIHTYKIFIGNGEHIKYSKDNIGAWVHPPEEKSE